jgi:hypothetical protein
LTIATVETIRLKRLVALNFQLQYRRSIKQVEHAHRDLDFSLLGDVCQKTLLGIVRFEIQSKQSKPQEFKFLSTKLMKHPTVARPEHSPFADQSSILMLLCAASKGFLLLHSIVDTSLTAWQ